MEIYDISTDEGNLEDVFIDLDNTEDNSVEIDEFYDLSSWDKYRN